VRLLLVEDDDEIVKALVPALNRRGFTVDRLPDGRRVLDRLVGVDLVLLDRRLPDTDGISLCRRIKAISDVPIIMVSALGDVSDRVLGLHAGADDYIVKPYDETELVERVYAVLRRGGGVHPPVGTAGETIAVGDVRIRLGRRDVLVADQRIPLSRKHFQLLALVAESGGAVCTRERIMTEVWDGHVDGQENILDDAVRDIRIALGRPWIVETVHHIGFRLGRPPATSD
jgi:DNA-binding response OmpR family regulator